MTLRHLILIEHTLLMKEKENCLESPTRNYIEFAFIFAATFHYEISVVIVWDT